MRSIDASTGVPLDLQVTRRLKEDIAAGIDGEGDAAPSLRVASAELRVKLHTVGKAYALLERDGILTRKRGDASRVAVVPSATEDLLRADVEVLLDRAETLRVSTRTVMELIEDALRSRVRRRG